MLSAARARQCARFPAPLPPAPAPSLNRQIHSLTDKPPSRPTYCVRPTCTVAALRASPPWPSFARLPPATLRMRVPFPRRPGPPPFPRVKHIHARPPVPTRHSPPRPALHHPREQRTDVIGGASESAGRMRSSSSLPAQFNRKPVTVSAPVTDVGHGRNPLPPPGPSESLPHYTPDKLGRSAAPSLRITPRDPLPALFPPAKPPGRSGPAHPARSDGREPFGAHP